MNPRRRHKQKAHRKLRGAMTPKQYAHKVARDKRNLLKYPRTLYDTKGRG